MIWFLAAAFINTDPLPKQTKTGADNFTAIFNIIMGTMAVLAFFMIVLAGMRYAASQGEPDKISGAKRTITYSIIGLVVIALAATLVNFVVGRT